MDSNIFEGVIPALMTPCDTDRNPVFEGLVERAETLINAGMVSVVYCGSMGDWPLLTDEQRQSGVQPLCDAGIPVVVGTPAVRHLPPSRRIFQRFCPRHRICQR